METYGTILSECLERGLGNPDKCAWTKKEFARGILSSPDMISRYINSPKQPIPQPATMVEIRRRLLANSEELSSSDRLLIDKLTVAWNRRRAELSDNSPRPVQSTTNPNAQKEISETQLEEHKNVTLSGLFHDTQISRKFPMIMVSFALISVFVTGAIAYYQAKISVEQGIRSKLIALAESREITLLQYFESVVNDLEFHSSSKLIREAIINFSESWKYLPENTADYLQDHYILRNPYVDGERDRFLFAEDGSQYSGVHELYHTSFINLVATRQFHDVFLIDINGNILYTAKKENDFAVNILSSPLGGLTQAFNAATGEAARHSVYFSDFGTYPPSENQPAAFVAAPVYDEAGSQLGVLAFQISIEAIDAIMQVTAGMGETGETYLVGPDFTMRSDSRFSSDRNILRMHVDTLSARLALAGEEGVHIVPDYRGVSVYSAYRPFEFFGIRWALLAEVDEQEAAQPILQLNLYLAITGTVIAIVVTALGYLIAIDLATPITSMIETMDRLAKQDLSTSVPISDRRDEVGLMSRALSSFKSSAIEHSKLRERLAYLEKHDPLTGLLNRSHALNHLEVLLDEAKHKNIAIYSIIVGLNGLDQVSGECGPDIRDQMLVDISIRIKKALGDKYYLSQNTFNQFLIFGYMEGKSEVSRIATDIIYSAKRYFGKSDLDINMSINVGISGYPSDASSMSDMLINAEKALRLSQDTGENHFLLFDKKWA